MYRPMLTGAAALAATALSLSAPAFATPSTHVAFQPITVSSHVHEITAYQPYNMIPGTEYLDRARVNTSDLNLRQLAGQRTLEKRVEQAAEDACSKLYNEGLSSEIAVGSQEDCAKNAVKQAQPEVARIIADAK